MVGCKKADDQSSYKLSTTTYKYRTVSVSKCNFSSNFQSCTYWPDRFHVYFFSILDFFSYIIYIVRNGQFFMDDLTTIVFCLGCECVGVVCQSKRIKDRKEQINGSWPGTCIQYTRLHIGARSTFLNRPAMRVSILQWQLTEQTGAARSAAQILDALPLSVRRLTLFTDMLSQSVIVTCCNALNNEAGAGQFMTDFLPLTAWS